MKLKTTVSVRTQAEKWRAFVKIADRKGVSTNRLLNESAIKYGQWGQNIYDPLARVKGANFTYNARIPTANLETLKDVARERDGSVNALLNEMIDYVIRRERRSTKFYRGITPHANG